MSQQIASGGNSKQKLKRVEEVRRAKLRYLAAIAAELRVAQKNAAGKEASEAAVKDMNNQHISDGGNTTDVSSSSSSSYDEEVCKILRSRKTDLFGKVVALSSDSGSDSRSEDDSEFTSSSSVEENSSQYTESSDSSIAIKPTDHGGFKRDTRNTMTKILTAREYRIKSQAEEITHLCQSWKTEANNRETMPAHSISDGNDIFEMLKDGQNQMESQAKEIESLRENIKVLNACKIEKEVVTEGARGIEIARNDCGTIQHSQDANYASFSGGGAINEQSNKDNATRFGNVGAQATSALTKPRKKVSDRKMIRRLRLVGLFGSEDSKKLSKKKKASASLPLITKQADDKYEFNNPDKFHKKRSGTQYLKTLLCWRPPKHDGFIDGSQPVPSSQTGTSRSLRVEPIENAGRQQQVSLTLFPLLPSSHRLNLDEGNMSLISTSEESGFSSSGGGSYMDIDTDTESEEEELIRAFLCRSDDMQEEKSQTLSLSPSQMKTWPYDEPLDDRIAIKKSFSPDTKSTDGLGDDHSRLHLVQRRLFEMGSIHYTQDFEFIPKYENHLEHLSNDNYGVKTEIWEASFPNGNDSSVPQETIYFATVVANEATVDIEKLQVALSSEVSFTTCPTIFRAPMRVVETMTGYKPSSTDAICPTKNLRLFLDESIIDLPFGSVGSYRDNIGSAATEKCLWISKANFLSIIHDRAGDVNFPSWIPRSESSSSLVDYDTCQPALVPPTSQKKSISDNAVFCPFGLPFDVFEADDSQNLDPVAKYDKSKPGCENPTWKSENGGYSPEWVDFDDDAVSLKSVSFVAESDDSVWPECKIVVTTKDSVAREDDSDLLYLPQVYKPNHVIQKKTWKNRFSKGSRKKLLPSAPLYTSETVAAHRGKRQGRPEFEEDNSDTSVSSFNSYDSGLRL